MPPPITLPAAVLEADCCAPPARSACCGADARLVRLPASPPAPAAAVLTVRLLCDGASREATTNRERLTPLHVAARHASSAVLLELLRAGCSATGARALSAALPATRAVRRGLALPSGRAGQGCA